MSIASAVEIDGVIANLTCPLCLSVFTSPVMLKCGHTFCLECVRSLEKEDGFLYPQIKCPQCRSSTSLYTKNVDGLQTNFALSNVVEIVKQHMQFQEDHQNGANTCLHLLQSQPKTICRHCNHHFCDSCRICHMEELKIAALKKADRILETGSSSDDEIMNQLNNTEVARLHSKLESVKSNIINVISERFDEILQPLDLFRDKQLKGLSNFVGNFLNPKNLVSLREKRNAVASNSVLFQKLDDIADFVVEADQQYHHLALFDAFMSFDSPIFSFKANKEIDGVIAQLKKLTLGEIKLNPTAVDVGCRFATQSLPEDKMYEAKARTNAENETIFLVVEEERDGIALVTRVIQQKDTGNDGNTASATPDSGLVFNVDNQDLPNSVTPLTPCIRVECESIKKIIPLPSRQRFAVLHGNNLFSLINPDTGEATASDFIPLKSLSIDDIASDDRSTIFLTASYEDDDGKQCRGIFRFWLGHRFAVKLCPFRTTEDMDSFRGIAVAKELGHIVTTEGNSIIVLSSINNPHYMPAWKVAEFELGPSPSVLGIRESATSNSIIHAICSTSNTVKHAECDFSSSGTTAAIRLKKSNGENFGSVTVRNLAVGTFANLICLWNREALLSKGYWIQKWDNFSEDSTFAGCYYLQTSDDITVGHRALSVIRFKENETAEERDIVALSTLGPNGCEITLSVLPDREFDDFASETDSQSVIAA